MIKNNETYGEITTLGQTQLLSLIKKDIPKNTIGKFLDIGCGYGKTVQFIAEHTNMQCIGVEIDKRKLDIASKIIWTNKPENIVIMHVDIQKRFDLVSDADIIFMNSVTWQRDLVSKIIDKSNGIVVYNRIDIYPKNIEKEKIKLDCNWSKFPQSFYKLNTKVI